VSSSGHHRHKKSAGKGLLSSTKYYFIMAIRPIAKKRQSAPPVGRLPVRGRSVGELLGWMRRKSGEHLARTYFGVRSASPAKAKSLPAKAPKKP